MSGINATIINNINSILDPSCPIRMLYSQMITAFQSQICHFHTSNQSCMVIIHSHCFSPIQVFTLFYYELFRLSKKSDFFSGKFYRQKGNKYGLVRPAAFVSFSHCHLLINDILPIALPVSKYSCDLPASSNEKSFSSTNGLSFPASTISAIF